MIPALVVESVSKSFKIQQNRKTTLKESFVGYLTGYRYPRKTLWALRNVSFVVDQGKSLGIIGNNGAGKSTLLRLLCGLGRPTTGRIRSNGSVSGLIEIGSGLHFDMTGRENIMTVGILNGLKKKQILGEQDEIISFAELEGFIDQPLRTYSGGMYLRLAFSSAIHLNPSILMIDEVLAVGDSRFQQKCVDRLMAFRKSGKTLVLVSHDMGQIQNLCDEVLVLEEGQVALQDEPQSAVKCYHDLLRRRSEKRAERLSTQGIKLALEVGRGNRLGTQEATIDVVNLMDERGMIVDTVFSGDSVSISLKYSVTSSVNDMALILGIYNDVNVKCFESIIPSLFEKFGYCGPSGALRCDLPKLPLSDGRYYVDVGLYPTDCNYIFDYHWRKYVLHVQSRGGVIPGVSGIVAARPEWFNLQEV